jgi:hypothetical protein
LKNSDAVVDINRASETIRENKYILTKENLGYYEMKKHDPWLEEGCSKLLDRRKPANYSGYRIYVK